MMNNTPLLIALINGVVLLVGYLISRRGSKESNKQQAAANVLAEREADWKRRGEVIEDLRQVIEDRDETIAQKDKRIIHLLEVCSRAQGASVDTIAMLKQVVRSETAQEIADMGIAEAARHEREDH